MKAITNEIGAPVPTRTQAPVDEGGRIETGEAARSSYVAPRLERLGEWSALTLQQSIPIFP